MNFYVFWLAIAGHLSTLVQGQSYSPHKFPSLLEATIEELATGLENGHFSSVDLVNAYAARIHEVNSTLNVVTELNSDALTIAKQLDAERANGTVRGPLHGIPILIKNNIATNDSMSNTAGSFSLLGAKVPRDATVASKLRAAGAVILGKANLSQWANFRSDNSSNGWSAYGGQVYGAYYSLQDPSGSSSGSAVSSSIGLALAALGTETSGSILSPSSSNNCVGIKPTVGLTSRALVIPISQRQDTVGPIARTVKDAAYILSAIAGQDPYDNYTSAIPFKKIPNYAAACKYEALKGKRIGIPRNLFYEETNGDPVLAAFQNAIEVVKKAGATVIDNANVTDFSADQYFNGNSSLIVLEADFVSDLPGEYLSKLTYNPQNMQNLVDVDNFTKTFPPEEYPSRDTAVFDGSLELGFNNTSPEFWPYYELNVEVAGPQGILGVLKNLSLDALMIPTDFSPGMPAMVGTPGVTVPMGFYAPDTPISMNSRGNLVATGPNIPFGLTFLGPAFSEELLIGLAYAYEQRTMVRNQVQPFVRPNIDLAQVVGLNCSSVDLLHKAVWM